MNSLYPLRFQPIFQDYLWGGDRLRREYGKPTGSMSPVAESWEIVDHDAGQSIVLAGPLAGKTLREIMQAHGAELLGPEVHDAVNAADVPEHLRGRFPLLFKFLDAQQALSVQVHPNDSQAAQLNPPDLGKTEAWVVLQAESGASIYAGLNEGVDRAAFQQAVDAAETGSVLHTFEPSVGDCVMIPAGTVHAIGAGLLIAEIQQASNTTYRLHDWNRVGADGKPRELHVQAGLEAINFNQGPVDPCGNFAGLQQAPAEEHAVVPLVDCAKFSMQAIRLSAGSQQRQSAQPSCVMLALIEGQLEIEDDPLGAPLAPANTVLIPAGVTPSLNAIEDSLWLEITIPVDRGRKG